MIEQGFVREIRLRREKIGDPNVFPFSLPVVRHLSTLELDPHVTMLIGENGSGKSTLIEAIAMCAGFNPEGGNKNLQFVSHKTESSLHDHLVLVRGAVRERQGFFLRAESLFNLSSHVKEQGLTAYGWEDLHTMSHGEATLWVIKERFRGPGLFILDEPEAALSPQRQLSLLRVVHDLVRGGSQFIIATHSPILMGFPDALIYECSPEGIAPIAYQDTEHFNITRDFLMHPGRFLRHLFQDD